MHWDKIKEKHPKAWELYRQSEYYGWRLYLHQQNHRIFFNLFDEQEIYIEITYYYENEWGYVLFRTTGEEEIVSEDTYYTRTEAEEKAFEKAFDILENKLKG